MAYSPAPTPALPGPSPLDKVIGFFEMVFTGTAGESPEKTAEVNALIAKSFAAGYTFNGQPFTPAQLIGWRASLLQRFPQMVFRVKSAISTPVDAGTPSPTTAVVIAWTVHTIDTAGVAWELNGMNMLGNENGVATSNVQLGDADKGWRQVPATP